MLVYRQSSLPFLAVGNPLSPYLSKIYLHEEVLPHRALGISQDVSGFYDFGIRDQSDGSAGILDKGKPCLGRVNADNRSQLFNTEAAVVYSKNAAKLFRFVKFIAVKDCSFGADYSTTDVCYMAELGASQIDHNQTLIVAMNAPFDIAGECGSVVYSPWAAREQRFCTLYDFLLAVNAYCDINVFQYKTVRLAYSQEFCRVEDGIRYANPAHVATIKFLHTKEADVFFTKSCVLSRG